MEEKVSQSNIEPEKPVSPTERNQRIQEIILDLNIRVLGTEIEDDYYEKVLKYFKHIKEAYPNYQDYSVYHAITGSSMTAFHPEIIETDFPGEDSAEKFVDNLAKKYRL